MAAKAENTQASKAVHSGPMGRDGRGGLWSRDVNRFSGREWQSRDDRPETQTQPGPRDPIRTRGVAGR